MSRQYTVKSTMFIDRFTTKVVQPDEQLVATLHRLLDMIDDDSHALMIDHCVAQLLMFHDPNIPGRMTPPELLKNRAVTPRRSSSTPSPAASDPA